MLSGPSHSRQEFALRLISFVAALACAVICVAHLTAASAFAVTLDDGTYSVEGKVLQASSSQSSMADGAFSQPMTLTVSGSSQTLAVTVKPVTVSGLTAYLGWVKYYPDYTDAAIPKNISPTAAKVFTYYTVTDEYNDPKTGTDSDMKGRSYVKKISFTVPKGTSTFFLQLYMPLMESIIPGGGTQYARMVLDLDTIQAIEEDEGDSGDSDDKEASEELTNCYQRLGKYLSQADVALKKTSLYTTSSLERLRTQRNAAQVVYEQGKAGRAEVENATDSLIQAIIDLKVRSSTSSSSKGSSAKSSSSSKKQVVSTLSFSNLEDGTYHLRGRMVKLDKKTYSMADVGINHSITLKVQNGHYYIILQFKAVAVGSKTSYLGRLRYFTAGYKASSSGISGSTKRAAVLSYQMANGSRLVDSFGINYPLQACFELVSQAKKSGYAPLQVYVPAMESIAKGTGTQQLYLKLDKSSVSGGAASTKASSSGQNSSGSASSTGVSDSEAGVGSSIESNTLFASGSGESDEGSVLSQESSLTTALDESAESSVADDEQLGGTQTSGATAEEKQPPLKGVLAPALACILGACAAGLAWYLFRNRRKLAFGHKVQAKGGHE